MTQLHFFRLVIITKPIYLKNSTYFYGIKPIIIIAILQLLLGFAKLFESRQVNDTYLQKVALISPTLRIELPVKITAS